MENEKKQKPKATIKFKYQGVQLEDTSYVKDHDYKKWNQKKTKSKPKIIIPTMRDVLY